ncbi:MAG TPA: FIST N-terminal domain-containing protein [Chthoniobacterales bacterium]
MPPLAYSLNRQGVYDPQEVTAAAWELRQKLGRPAALAFAFVTSDFLPHLEEFCELIRVDGHVTHVVGCTTSGSIQGAVEFEHQSGFSLLAVAASAGSLTALAITEEQLEAARGPADWRFRAQGLRPSGWIALLNPGEFSCDDWLKEWNAAFPQVPCAGGLASGSGDESTLAVFLDGKAIPGGVVVGIQDELRLRAVISQGCRPIGEPLTVTRAESNVIYSLGSQPAYAALETAFQSLSDSEKSTARGNLFAGLASSEYLEDFKSGDFLIRNIIGADPNSGAVVIAGIPRVGQTVQYQFRDREVASQDLRDALQRPRKQGSPPVASLLFSCTGRGERLFGSRNHDAALVAEIWGAHPSAGFFCNGEIGPISGINGLHGYTASVALLEAAAPPRA